MPKKSHIRRQMFQVDLGVCFFLQVKVGEVEIRALTGVQVCKNL